jgi:pyruvate dehydrogenase E2 component (dihydrolipoyllysine-residue acetyltransferase)
MKKIIVPDLGGFDNVEIIEMFISEGDSVEKETSLFSLESDKAVMDIPSPYGGVLLKLFVTAGDKVSTGDIIGEIETSGKNEDETSLNNPVEKSVEIIEDVSKVGLEPDQNKTELISVNEDIKISDPTPEHFKEHGAVFHASPSIRQYARDLDIDLSVIKGSGPKGRITKETLLSFIKNGPGSSVNGQNISGIPKIQAEDYSSFGNVEEISLSRIKKITGERLTGSWLNIPHVTQFDEADITDLELFRKELGYSILPFIIKALSSALKKYPRFNSSLSTSGESLIIKEYFNIGIAVDTEKGLVVPVIRDADNKSVSIIMEELKGKSELARNGLLQSEDFQGGSFTISSLGGISGTGFTPIVNAPQAAILGVSRSAMKPVWNGSEFKPRLILPFSVSYDHRIIDGAEAARFTKYLGELLEDIRKVIL